MMNGFAYHRIVLDEKGEAVGYVFLEVNSTFEKMTGLKRDDIIGKRVREAGCRASRKIRLTGSPFTGRSL